MLSERHRGFFVPKEEIDRRVRTFQSILREMDLSAAWIDHLTDRCYFSGSIQNGILLIPAEGQPRYFVKKSVARAESESPLEVLPYPGRKGLLKKIAESVGSKGRLGASMDVTPVSTYRWLRSILAEDRMVDTSLPVRLQKAVKSGWEVAQIAKAAEQADTLFREVKDHFRTGMTELALSAAVEGRLRALGHAGVLRIRHPGSDLPLVNVVSGKSALYPTNFDGPAGGEGPFPSSPSGAGWKPIGEGETFIVDMVTSYNGYYADHTRTYYVGRSVPETAKKAHDFCLGVLSRLESSLRPGRDCGGLYEEIQDWAEKQGVPEGFMGYGENRVRFFGHGVGLELDEFPIIAQKIDVILKPGMVVAVEPKAFLEGLGPVGVENTYVVTETGCRRLCTAEHDIVPLMD